MDFGKISDLQLRYIEGLDGSELLPADKIKFGRVLISNYKKAKQILKSRVDFYRGMALGVTGICGGHCAMLDLGGNSLWNAVFQVGVP